MKSLICIVLVVACGRSATTETPKVSAVDRCDLDALARRMYDAHRVLLDRLDQVDWSDCSRARVGLEGNAPAARNYVTEMRAIKDEVPAGSDCSRRFAERTSDDPQAKQIATRLAHVLDAEARADERCHDTPGWRDAVDVAITGTFGRI